MPVSDSIGDWKIFVQLSFVSSKGIYTNVGLNNSSATLIIILYCQKAVKTTQMGIWREYTTLDATSGACSYMAARHGR